MPYTQKQYDSAKAFLGKYNNSGNIVDPQDNTRLKAYCLYDDLYYNRPETFRVTMRGDSDVEIYLPSTKKIVNATARFLAVDFDFTITGGDQGAVTKLMKDVFEREEISKRFIVGKRSMLTRGDMVWYITADPTKPVGKRLTICTIHPSSVFRIENPENNFKVEGYHLVDLVHDVRYPNDKSKKVARRQTYRKRGDRISSEAMLFEIGGWDDRFLKREDLKPVSRLWPERLLPEGISQLPIYHVPNDEPDGSTWGLSQVSGIEYIVNAINQSITYEDLSLVLQGLGVYVTTAAPPIDQATGKKGKYKLHPGNVVEMSQGDTFERVTGVASVAPFQEHMTLMDRWAMDGSGIPDMATGSVDVTVAQSGIALALKMGPIIAENSDKQLAIAAKWNQLGYDLIHGWFPAFEGLDSGASKFKAIFGDPMPINRETYTRELIDLFTADMITFDEMRERLEKVGYQKLSGAQEKLLDQAREKASAASGELFPEAGAFAPELMDSF